MLNWLKRLVMLVIALGLLITAVCYGVLTLSLPMLDGTGRSDAIEHDVEIGRDVQGQAVVTAKTRQDAAYGLGYAHGQDRFFQMDLLRRNAAGELSELFGEAAVNLDKRMRFHQLRKRSELILRSLPVDDQAVLAAYAKGANEGRAQTGYSSFEYLLTGAPIKAWQPEDSLLVIFAMYLDLQEGTFQRDRTLIELDTQFGSEMRAFLTQPSRYQAALDGSKLALSDQPVPKLKSRTLTAMHHIDTPLDIGSNNWAVTGALTKTGAAMLSDDMHLSLNVPSIWYRAQLNYQQDGEAVQVTGVSLPGAPAIVVGTNDAIAWGFTNGYLDTADWIELDAETKTQIIKEEIALPNGQVSLYPLEMSEFGPVETFNGKRYALSWVGHQLYAVNLNLLKLETAQSAQQAIELAPSIGIPVQNLMVVDRAGNAGWTNMGAVPKRAEPSDIAVQEQDYTPTWLQNETDRPSVLNPQSNRLWTGNSRVVGVSDNLRFGDGGYALGARAMQIRDRLFESNQFAEDDFNALQHDNEARFLTPWHELLMSTLQSSPNGVDTYQDDLRFLQNWQRCACADSVGYTLVEAYRGKVLDVAFASIESALRQQGGSLKPIKRNLEPAIWKLIEAQPKSWLGQYESWDALLLDSYLQAKADLTAKHGVSMAGWSWGEVNALHVQHPFSRQIPLLSKLLDMPKMPAFGDTFMPAVQMPHFGASQRFIAQPGHLDNATMTMAGGQSGHPLSPYYRAGFEEYATGGTLPLLPGELEHRLTIQTTQQ
ncbi:penicillin acylase family protein [Pseudoalteromonas xiamenensis]|uniref:penicillin acylase family protein n=1 Tax=Pseudoalteromonas xiamenensis TaxID=882626 RepID=UPI0035EA06CB